VAKPRLGNREVKLSRVTHWIERKLQELVNVSELLKLSVFNENSDTVKKNFSHRKSLSCLRWRI
jgi:hypothetical protein